MTEVEENKNEGYWFALGSLKFRNFKDLHANIRGRTGNFKKPCSIIKNGQGLFNFPLKYEKTLGSEQFVLEWEPQLMTAFKADRELAEDLSEYLPRFQRVGCTAQGNLAKARYYGVLNIKALK